ncbi:hypothetical protein ACVXG7_17185 [Enterobacter hormaechei]
MPLMKSSVATSGNVVISAVFCELACSLHLPYLMQHQLYSKPIGLSEMT